MLTSNISVLAPSVKNSKSDQDVMKSKGRELIASVSHEIRTPMNSILGFSRLLADGSLPAIERDYVQTIIANAEATLRILDDLLDFSLLQTGTFQMEKRPFDVREIVEDVLKLFMLQVEAERDFSQSGDCGGYAKRAFRRFRTIAVGFDQSCKQCN